MGKTLAGLFVAFSCACTQSGVCSSDELRCGGVCVSPSTDSSHCGTCGTACTAGQRCTGGVCAATCASNLTACGAQCVDTQNDPQHCGSCAKTCAADQICSKGACGCASPSLSCPSRDGGTQCIDIALDPMSCGGCGHRCSPGELCVDGACRLDCPGLLSKCVTDAGAARCVDVRSDPKNCGGCGPEPTHVCLATPGRNTSAACFDGHCATACSDGFEACSDAVCSVAGLANEPCCESLQSSACDCGACDNTCAGWTPNFGDCRAIATGQHLQQCCGFRCLNLLSPTTCGNCGSIFNCAADGGACCANPDPNGPLEGHCSSLDTIDDCGLCGNECAQSYRVTPLCCGHNGPFCVDAHSDFLNCGACGNVCPKPTPDSIPACCETPDGGQGCSDLWTDARNCGTCGHDCSRVCSVPNSGVCLDGDCLCP